MRREPDHCYREVTAAQEEPEHAIEAKLWRHLHGIETCEHIARALEIYKDAYERERFQPWILAGATTDDIAERVGLHPDTTEAYRHLFFNVKMFRDFLDKQRWVSRYESRQGSSREGALFLQKAMLHGLEAIAHVMGAPSKLEPNYVLESAMRDMFFRGLAVRDSRLTSIESSAARNLLKDAVSLAEQQAKVKPPGVNDILIRIKTRDLTQPAEVVQATGEILH